jgi:two-component system nitrogen regulation response regulator NtrX
MAHTGTLLLDEVGELSAEAQAKLLRAIEAREIERVGGGRHIKVDVRVLAATNRDLAREVREGRFREDLYFRLNVIPISVPPLREHPGDIPDLVLHFATLHRRRSGQPAPSWSDAAVEAMTRYRWPGNVRELANIVERLAILHAGQEITPAHVQEVLPEIDIATAAPAALPAAERLEMGLSDQLDEYERLLIQRALQAANGVVADAARRLQTDRPNLYRRMRRLGLSGVE